MGNELFNPLLWSYFTLLITGAGTHLVGNYLSYDVSYVSWITWSWDFKPSESHTDFVSIQFCCNLVKGALAKSYILAQNMQT